MKRTCFAAFLIGSVVAAAAAAPYSIFYSGDDFPENEGWARSAFGGGAARSIAAGVLTLDATSSDAISDAYRIDRLVDAGPGELFEAEWRMRVNSHAGFATGVLAIARDQRGTLLLRCDGDSIINDTEGWIEDVPPNKFHTYRISSSNMLDYDFWINGNHVRSGQWSTLGLNRSFVAWGDTTSGGGSLVSIDFDYVQFRVVPEPATVACFAIVFLFFSRRY